jgi:flagellar export protein FliJ
MRKFKFRLQTNLGLVSKKEEIERQELFQCQINYQQALDYLKQQQQHYGELEEELRELQRNQLQLNLVQLYRNYLVVLNQNLLEQSKQTEMLRQQMHNCRIKVQGLMQDRKVLEKLKERYRREYTREINFQEQSINDELALHGFVRREMHKG